MGMPHFDDHPGMKPLTDCRLYTFVDVAYLDGREPAELARALCDGGSDIIQLRAKGVPKQQVEEMAVRILPITNSAGVWLVVNDFPEIAAKTGAAACHLGQEDFLDTGCRVAELRKGSVVGIGLSTHAPEEAERAVSAGADYIAIGPVFPTATKPTARAVTLDYVRWAGVNIRIPWFAIGGITLDNLDDVIAAGATRVCVVSAILNASNVAAACGAFKERLASPIATHH